MPKAVKVGDTGTDHDGFPPTPVSAGSPDVLFDGVPAARVDDPLPPHSKPKHPPHGRVIASGSSTVFINGKPAAITGGAISCGGVTIGSATINIGDKPPSPSKAKTATPAISTASATTAASNSSSNSQGANYAATVDNSATQARASFTTSMNSSLPNTQTETTLKSSLLSASTTLEALATAAGQNYQRGSHETADVKRIQQALIQMGFDLGKWSADGDFGGMTESAVKTFQQEFTVTSSTHIGYELENQDGIIDQYTLLALDEALMDSWKYKEPKAAVTKDMLRRIWPSSRVSEATLQTVADEVNTISVDVKLNSQLRLEHFFAQILEEVGEYFTLEEDFTYQESALWRFSYYKQSAAHRAEAKVDALPNAAGRKTMTQALKQAKYETIANKIYGRHREGTKYALGNTVYGDGGKYRGRGLKQLTGKDNYQKITNGYNDLWPEEQIDFVANPDKLLELKYAVRSAGLLWLTKGIWKVADKGASSDIVNDVTDIVNKGTTSKDDRVTHFKNIREGRVFDDAI